MFVRLHARTRWLGHIRLVGYARPIGRIRDARNIGGLGKRWRLQWNELLVSREHDVRPQLPRHRQLLRVDVRGGKHLQHELQHRQLQYDVPGERKVHRELQRRRLLGGVSRRIDVHARLPRRQLHHELHGRLVHDRLLLGRLPMHGHRLQVKRASSLLLAFALLSGSLAGARTAAAQNEKALAKEAYDRGTKAHERGDFRAAAEEFARADSLAPSPIALQAALDSAVDADDPVLGAELLQRSKRAPATGPLAASIDTATRKLGGRAGRVKVACPSGARCTATIDGAAFDSAKGIWMRPGPHTVSVVVDGGPPDTRSIDVRAAQEHEVTPVRGGSAAAPVAATPAPATPAPATAPAPITPAPTANHAGEKAESKSEKPLSPTVFLIGAGVTVVLAGASTYFGLAAGSRHDEFAERGCDKASNAACVDLKDRGESSQTLANVGFAATAAVGITTVVLGAFFTEWDGSKKAGRAPLPYGVAPIAGGMALGYRAAF
jgi:hypothetical protein